MNSAICHQLVAAPLIKFCISEARHLYHISILFFLATWLFNIRHFLRVDPWLLTGPAARTHIGVWYFYFMRQKNDMPWYALLHSKTLCIPLCSSVFPITIHPYRSSHLSRLISDAVAMSTNTDLLLSLSLVDRSLLACFPRPEGYLKPCYLDFIPLIITRWN